MSSFKEWVIQLRYPYTAGVIAVVWVGTALFALIRHDAPIEMFVSISAGTTILVALTGFSSGKR